ncbi:MAG: flippase [Candidatus Shapirobacteria bacterium]
MKRKIFKNALFLSGSQILGRIIGFFYFIFLARALGVEVFGIYAWVLGFVYNFYPLADFGLEKIVMRDLPRQPEKANYYLKRLLPLRVWLAFFTLILLLLAGLIMGLGLQKLFFVFLFGLTILPSNLIYLIAFIENSREKAEIYAFVNLAISLGAVILGWFIINFGLPISFLFLTFFISCLLTLLILLKSGRKLNLEFDLIVDLPFWKRILTQSWVFAVIITLAVFYLRISLVLVGRILGDYSAGIYAAASKFVEAGVMIPQGLTLALFPLSSRLLIENKKKLKKIYFLVFLCLLFVSLPVAAIMHWGGKYIIPLVYGAEYLPSVPVFSLMGLLVIFLFVNSIAGNVIHNSNKVKQFIPFAFLNFLVALILGLVLIPRFGVIGGVWAMIGGEIFGLIINNFFVFKILRE